MDGGWGNREKMELLVQTIQESNAIRYSIDEAKEHVEKALEAIKGYEATAEHKLLTNLANYVVDRSF
jgi:geranylgeranyl pyrophosphate synthase